MKLQELRQLIREEIESMKNQNSYMVEFWVRGPRDERDMSSDGHLRGFWGDKDGIEVIASSEEEAIDKAYSEAYKLLRGKPYTPMSKSTFSVTPIGNEINEFWGSKLTMDDIKTKLENLMNGKTADGKKELKDEFKMNSNQKEGLKSIISSGKLDDFKPSQINNNITNGNAKATAKDIVIMTIGKGKGFSAASV